MATDDQDKRSQPRKYSSRGSLANELESAAELAKFPSDNPNPVLRLALDGAVIYANQPALPLLHCAVDTGALEIPEDWIPVLDEVWSSGKNKVIEMETADHVLNLTFVPIAEFNYINVYGSDISNLKRLEEELRRLSHIDGLTEIPNRRTFNKMLEREWLRARRNKSSLSAIMIDVDDFKKFNDHYGHQQGDDCLRAIAVALSKSLKRPSDFVSRYGGEEFAAILADTDSKGAEEVAEEMRRQVESLDIADEDSSCGRRATISLGVSTVVPGEETTARQLIATADSALYSSKNAGKNRVSLGGVKGVSRAEFDGGS